MSRHPDLRGVLNMGSVTRALDRASELLSTGTPPDCPEHALGVAVAAALDYYRKATAYVPADLTQGPWANIIENVRKRAAPTEPESREEP